MNIQKRFFLFILLLLLTNPLLSTTYYYVYEKETYDYKKDIIIEFKAAYFQPTNHTFRKMYHGSALFGPEVTFRIFHGIYGFASLDYFTKSGHSLRFDTPTHVSFMPLGIGLKYLWPIGDIATLYAGLGFTPTYLTTKNCSPYVEPKTHNWGFGGIAKLGTFIELPHQCMFDFFIDYSFVKVKPHTTCSATNFIEEHKANLSGVIIGGGLGYRFD